MCELTIAFGQLTLAFGQVKKVFNVIFWRDLPGFAGNQWD